MEIGSRTSAFAFLAHFPASLLPLSRQADVGSKSTVRVTFALRRRGESSTNHLAGEMFRLATGIDIVHMPYKGNGPAELVNDSRPEHAQLGIK